MDTEPLDLALDTQRGQTCTEGVVFQSHWCAEYRHEPVTRELVDGPAEAIHNRRRSLD